MRLLNFKLIIKSLLTSIVTINRSRPSIRQRLLHLYPPWTILIMLCPRPWSTSLLCRSAASPSSRSSRALERPSQRRTLCLKRLCQQRRHLSTRRQSTTTCSRWTSWYHNNNNTHNHHLRRPSSKSPPSSMLPHNGSRPQSNSSNRNNWIRPKGARRQSVALYRTSNKRRRWVQKACLIVTAALFCQWVSNLNRHLQAQSRNLLSPKTKVHKSLTKRSSISSQSKLECKCWPITRPLATSPNSCRATLASRSQLKAVVSSSSNSSSIKIFITLTKRHSLSSTCHSRFKCSNSTKLFQICLSSRNSKQWICPKCTNLVTPRTWMVCKCKVVLSSSSFSSSNRCQILYWSVHLSTRLSQMLPSLTLSRRCNWWILGTLLVS